MQLATSAIANKLDILAETTYNINGEALMDNASTSLCEELTKHYDKSHKIAVFCGKGKNGGDGFFLATKLHKLGYIVQVIVCFSEGENIHHLTEKGAVLVRHLNVPILFVNDFISADVIIDGILGTGFQGEITGTYKLAIDKINHAKSTEIISIDLPSGLNCDNGKIANVCVIANKTYTLAINKIGLTIYPGADYAGKVTVLPIGIPQGAYATIDCKINLTTKNIIKSILTKRINNSHKGMFGKVAVFGGSKGMAGAVYLASTAVLKAGAGVSYAVVPDEIFSIIENKVTEVMVKQDKYYKEVFDLVDTVVVGCGYIANSKISHIMKLAQQLTKPLVVDAEGLKYIDKNHKCPLIITPHPGEFGQLLSLKSDEINSNRVYLAGKYAKENNVVVVLKGAKTVIAAPNGDIRINSTGTNGMATAGTGDVLAGLIGGLVAQGLSPFDGATIGAYIHGLAGEIAAGKDSDHSLMATDLLANIGGAFHVFKL